MVANLATISQSMVLSKSEQTPTSIKASGGLQRCALEFCHANA